MDALLYLYQRTFINRVTKAVKKPVTWIYIVLIIAYAVFIICGMLAGTEEVTLTSPVILVVVLSGISLLLIPANIMTYAKRKGLIFRPSDSHFVFTAPISPKKFYSMPRSG